jgi:hypothetical protein
MKFEVVYRKHDGKREQVTVEVSQDASFGFYGVSLATLGCGKCAADPVRAVERLVSDHGQIISIIQR